jgi:hypothetical protein
MLPHDQISHRYESKFENGCVVPVKIQEIIRTTECITNQLGVIKLCLLSYRRIKTLYHYTTPISARLIM